MFPIKFCLLSERVKSMNDEWEDENHQKSRGPIKPPDSDSLRMVLRRIFTNNELVTLIIKSGANCCELTGCIASIKKDHVILMTQGNSCRKIFVKIDCICAVVIPDEVPVPPPPAEECECQVTGAGLTGFSSENASIQLAVCTGCTLEQSLVRYENNMGEEVVELSLLPAGSGEITSVNCENDQLAIIEGIAQVTIGENDLGLCEFTLEVTDTPPPSNDTIDMVIICNDNVVHDSGELDLLGQSINIVEC